MRNRINKAIAHLNLEIAGGGRDGVFYFVSLETDWALEHSVYVSAMTHLPIKRWVEEAEAASCELASSESSIALLIKAF
jgi:hypothetical protein